MLLLLGSAVASKAQGLPGYVLTLHGDSLQGTIREKNDYQLIELTNQQGGGKQLFRPDEVRGYGLGNLPPVQSKLVKRAASAALTPAFVVSRQLGTANLYTFANETGLLLQPPATDTLFELTPQNWHLLFIKRLAGCPSSQWAGSYFLDLPFSDKYVLRELASYNTCRNPAWQNQRHQQSHFWVSSLGVQASYGRVKDGKSPEPYQQLGLQWQLVRASGVQLTVSAGYLRLNHHKDLVPYSYSPNGNQWYSTPFRNNIFHGQILFGRRFSVAPHLNLLTGLGMGADYVLSSTTYYYEQNSAGALLLTAKVRNPDGWLTTHLLGSLGVSIPVGRRQELQMLTQYQWDIYYGLKGPAVCLAYLFQTGR
ncbi:hypothetical protein LF252_10265 [Hymenobacter sp. BT728]|nr:hypothetical protein [Hymenobacter pini]